MALVHCAALRVCVCVCVCVCACIDIRMCACLCVYENGGHSMVECRVQAAIWLCSSLLRCSVSTGPAARRGGAVRCDGITGPQPPRSSAAQQAHPHMLSAVLPINKLCVRTPVLCCQAFSDRLTRAKSEIPTTDLIKLALDPYIDKS